MPDTSILDASKTIIDNGVLGAILILVIGALIWVTRQWLKTLSSLDTEKGLRLQDAKDFASSGESTRNAMKDTATALQANTEQMRAFLDATRERRRA